jgi:hypothetical protein
MSIVLRPFVSLKAGFSDHEPVESAVDGLMRYLRTPGNDNIGQNGTVARRGR